MVHSYDWFQKLAHSTGNTICSFSTLSDVNRAHLRTPTGELASSGTHLLFLLLSLFVKCDILFPVYVYNQAAKDYIKGELHEFVESFANRLLCFK